MKDLGKLFTLADHQTKSAKYQAAIKTYQQILDNSGMNSKAQHLAHWGIGEIHLNNKQYDKAELHLKQALELSPAEPIYHYLLGCTYRYVNNVEGALLHLQKAVDIDPTKEQYWAELGWVVGYNRDVNKGIEYLKKSLSINPKNTASLKDICMLYTKQHKWGEALVCIETALEHDPGNLDISRIKADVEHFRSEFQRLSGKSAK